MDVIPSLESYGSSVHPTLAAQLRMFSGHLDAQIQNTTAVWVQTQTQGHARAEEQSGGQSSGFVQYEQQHSYDNQHQHQVPHQQYEPSAQYVQQQQHQQHQQTQSGAWYAPPTMQDPDAAIMPPPMFVPSQSRLPLPIQGQSQGMYAQPAQDFHGAYMSAQGVPATMADPHHQQPAVMPTYQTYNAPAQMQQMQTQTQGLMDHQTYAAHPHVPSHSVPPSHSQMWTVPPASEHEQYMYSAGEAPSSSSLASASTTSASSPVVYTPSSPYSEVPHPQHGYSNPAIAQTEMMPPPQSHAPVMNMNFNASSYSLQEAWQTWMQHELPTPPHGGSGPRQGQQPEQGHGHGRGQGQGYGPR